MFLLPVCLCVRVHFWAGMQASLHSYPCWRTLHLGLCVRFCLLNKLCFRLNSAARHVAGCKFCLHTRRNRFFFYYYSFYSCPPGGDARNKTVASYLRTALMRSLPLWSSRLKERLFVESNKRAVLFVWLLFIFYFLGIEVREESSEMRILYLYVIEVESAVHACGISVFLLSCFVPHFQRCFLFLRPFFLYIKFYDDRVYSFSERSISRRM